MLHWNYFVALESDLDRLARFVEFTESNYNTHSIEMVRLLLIACSEVDTLARQLSAHFDSSASADSMDSYRDVLRPRITRLELGVVEIPKHALILEPWMNWREDRSPDWWREHQGVKHRRNEEFEQANLSNALNAVAGLLLLTICFYHNMTDKRILDPPPRLFKPGLEFGRTTAIVGAGVGFQLAGGINVY